MKVSSINQTNYRQNVIQGRIENQTNRPIGTGMELSNFYYYPTNISFGIANATKLKRLISRGMPCMYTGYETIDPKRVQKMLKNKVFNQPVGQVIRQMARFEWNMRSSDEVNYIEEEVYYILKEQAELYPDKTIKEIFMMLAPQYKKDLLKMQEPIFKTLKAHSYSLPQEYRYRMNQLLQETDDKINERPVALPFSVTEFRYKLDKIKQDVAKLHDKNALGIVNRLIKLSEDFEPKTTAKNIYKHRKILASMEAYVKRSVLADNEQIQELMEASKSRLNEEKIKIPFSRKAFIFDIDRILSELNDDQLKNIFIKIAEKLPTSRNSVAAYITKFSKEPSEKIGYRLLWPWFGTVEHLNPKFNGGEDCMANYGVATARENSDRSSVPFTEQIERRPNTEKYSQKYVDRLISYAELGILEEEGVKTKCIEDFKNAVASLSEGQIVLDVSKLNIGRFCKAKPAYKIPDGSSVLYFDKHKFRVLKG